MLRRPRSGTPNCFTPWRPILRTRLLLLFPLLCACASLGPHALLPFPVQRPVAWTWEEVFAHPTALKVTAFKTGEVFTGPAVLIEKDHPNTPAEDKVDRWVPSVTYLVEHPQHGAMLMDAGVHGGSTGDCSYGIKPVFWIPCKVADGHTALPALQSHGLAAKDLRYVMLSHFHGDHASGLPALAANAPLNVLTTGNEWDDVNAGGHLLKGYFYQHMEGPYTVTRLEPGTAVDMPLVGRSWDLFGDGSIWLFPTPGHTRGQLSALLNTMDGPLLLTFDASHLRSNFIHQVPPGYTVDRDAAVSSLAHLKALADAFPAMRVIFGHEPSQWPDGVFEQQLSPTAAVLSAP